MLAPHSDQTRIGKNLYATTPHCKATTILYNVSRRTAYIIAPEERNTIKRSRKGEKVALHSPCYYCFRLLQLYMQYTEEEINVLARKKNVPSKWPVYCFKLAPPQYTLFSLPAAVPIWPYFLTHILRSLVNFLNLQYSRIPLAIILCAYVLPTPT